MLTLAALRLLSFVSVLTLCHVQFNPLQHSGPASPYFDAPSPNVTRETPEGCVVDQAAYLLRHGARFPEPGSFTGWQSLFDKLQNSSYQASGPLRFLPTWVPAVDDEAHQPLYLTSTGAKEAFELGVQLRQQYGFTMGGSNLTVWAASQQRVVDTATFFLRGYLSQGNYLTTPNLNRGTIISLPDSVNYTFANSLTPSSSCPNYALGNNGSSISSAFRQTYRSRIASRLNEFLDGLVLTDTDIGVMQDLCGFQTAINGNQEFCRVFSDEEWLDYEYAHDLNYFYGSGPGNPYSATTAYPWLKAISDLFEDGPGQNVSSPLIMAFTHDNNIPPLLSALGLWNDIQLPKTSRLDERTFHSSYLVSFRGTVALERLKCSTDSASEVAIHQAGVLPSRNATTDGEVYVRVKTNNAPVALPSCSSGPGSSCPLADFLEYVRGPRAEASGDFVETCGLSGVSNATSTVTFLQEIPEDAEVLVVGL